MQCARHPGTSTEVACGRCGKAICPRCMVTTREHFLRCVSCAGVRGPGFVSSLFGWLLLMPLWRALFRPRLLQNLFGFVMGLLLASLVVGAVGAARRDKNPHLTAAGAAYVSAIATTEAEQSDANAAAELLGSDASTACGGIACGSSDGVRLVVTEIDRSWQPSAKAFVTPSPGFHLIRMLVSFIDDSGEHEVSAFALNLKDALGYQHGPALLYGPDCSPQPSRSALAPGGVLGPVPLCFEVGGAADAPLTLIWVPSGLPVGKAVQFPLP